jgi:hypothetical protein
LFATFLENSRESFNELLYPTVLILTLFQGGVSFGIIAQYLASAFRHKTLLWSGMPLLNPPTRHLNGVPDKNN